MPVVESLAKLIKSVMSKNPSQSSKQPSPAGKRPQLVANPLGYDFALLGLKAREARVEVIRKAARQTASRINGSSEVLNEQDEMLSHLATSTYRLLDPRRRDRSHERIQLCIFSEEDLESQKRSRVPLLPRPRRSQRITAELVA